MTGWYFQGVVLGTLPAETQGKTVLGLQCVFCYQMREHRSQRKWGSEQAFRVAMGGTGDNSHLHTVSKEERKRQEDGSPGKGISRSILARFYSLVRGQANGRRKKHGGVLFILSDKCHRSHGDAW